MPHGTERKENRPSLRREIMLHAWLANIPESKIAQLEISIFKRKVTKCHKILTIPRALPAGIHWPGIPICLANAFEIRAPCSRDLSCNEKSHWISVKRSSIRYDTILSV